MDAHLRVPATRRISSVSLVLGATVVIAVAVFALSRSSMFGALEAAPTSGPDYLVTIAGGLDPKWTAGEAATAALDGIAKAERRIGRQLAPAKVLSVQALPGTDVPGTLGEAEGTFDSYPIVWVVKATGTFVADYGLPL